KARRPQRRQTTGSREKYGRAAMPMARPETLDEGCGRAMEALGDAPDRHALLCPALRFDGGDVGRSGARVRRIGTFAGRGRRGCATHRRHHDLVAPARPAVDLGTFAEREIAAPAEAHLAQP